MISEVSAKYRYCSECKTNFHISRYPEHYHPHSGYAQRDVASEKE